jgi:RNA-directed DNA polymerase
MSTTKRVSNMSPGLSRVVEIAKQDPDTKIHSLASLIDVDALKRAFDRLRPFAAVGVDEVTKDQYEQNLKGNLQALYERMKAGRYRHQPIRRVHIPKAPGKTRPIGISCIEDKIVQNALSEVLGAVYEQDFRDCSYGFRPKRSAHDALRALDRAAMRGEGNYILEADFSSYFDSIDRKVLLEMIRQRIADERLMRLVGKCLHVGVLDGAEYTEPDTGAVQGSTLSPLLGNIYLHHALDLWFEQDVQPRLKGRARLIRYADDFVITFEHREDAERVMQVIPQRMARFGLTLHPDKTRLVPFQRPPKGTTNGGGPTSFNLLGFTVYWRQSRSGRWVVGMKTQREKLRRMAKAIGEFCRRHRHDPIPEQHAALCTRIQGHFNYFGVNGNLWSLTALKEHAQDAWRKWLNRRSQNARMTWERFEQLLKRWPLPAPRVCVQLWAGTL